MTELYYAMTAVSSLCVLIWMFFGKNDKDDDKGLPA